VIEARRGIGGWISFYNDVRPHQALGYRTPRAVFAGEACEHVDNPSASLRRSGVTHMLTGTTSRKGNINVLTQVEWGLY
jgi:transposase InsO family protein